MVLFVSPRYLKTWKRWSNWCRYMRDNIGVLVKVKFIFTTPKFKERSLFSRNQCQCNWQHCEPPFYNNTTKEQSLHWSTLKRILYMWPICYYFSIKSFLRFSIFARKRIILFLKAHTTRWRGAWLSRVKDINRTTQKFRSTYWSSNSACKLRQKTKAGPGAIYYIAKLRSMRWTHIAHLNDIARRDINRSRSRKQSSDHRSAKAAVRGK